jgi:hypothetical protein
MAPCDAGVEAVQGGQRQQFGGRQCCGQRRHAGPGSGLQHADQALGNIDRHRRFRRRAGQRFGMLCQRPPDEEPGLRPGFDQAPILQLAQGLNHRRHR